MIKQYIKLINCFKEYVVSIKPPKHYRDAFNSCICFKHTNKELLFIIYFTNSINNKLIEIIDSKKYERSTRIVFTADNVSSNKLNDNYIHLTNLQDLISNLIEIN